MEYSRDMIKKYGLLLKVLSFGTLALITLLLIIGTIAGKVFGVEIVATHLYSAWWMIALWALAALSGGLYIVRLRLWQRVGTFGLHTALLTILVGALITHLTGIRGRVHLREDMPPTREYCTADGAVRRLPFALSLTDFEQVYYPGSTAPMDYVSQLVFIDADGAETSATVAMNKIFNHRHWRFYQADFDADSRGGTLSISHDPCGIAVTYIGYLLLLVSMIGVMFQPKGGFRSLLRRARQHRALQCTPFVLLAAAIASGLLVASGAGVDESGYVPPILRSPYLGIHVTLIMASYLLLAIVMLGGIVGEVLRHCRGSHADTIAHLSLVGRLLLYPAIALLAIGIFVGAVWANVSWGRYWGWDPKEVWALVTLFVYAAPLHGRSLSRLTQPHTFHRYCIVAFLSVIITYFGVNLLLGGMHSYA